MNDQTARQAERPKSQEPCFTSAEALKRREEVSLFSTPIFNKRPPPPPKTATPTPDASKQEAPKKEEAPQPETNGTTEEEMPQAEENGKSVPAEEAPKSGMDID